MTDLRKNEQGLRDRVEEILAEASRQGASAAEVSVSEDVGLSVTVRRQELESVEFNHDRGFGITVYLGNRNGSASTSDWKNRNGSPAGPNCICSPTMKSMWARIFSASDRDFSRNPRPGV